MPIRLVHRTRIFHTQVPDYSRSPRDPKPAAAIFPCPPHCLLIVGGGLAFVVASVIVIALIPAYLPDPNYDPSIIERCTQQRILFLLPDNVSLPEGGLSPSIIAEIQKTLQLRLIENSDQVIATSQVVVQDASVITVNQSARFKRDLTTIRLEEITSYEVEAGDRLLAVTCQVLNEKMRTRICTAKYQQLLRLSLSSLSIPISLLTNGATVTETSTSIGTTMTTESTRCIDTPNYYESGTYHTCQTYKDYYFCNGTHVTNASFINVAEATASCCVCGKSF